MEQRIVIDEGDHTLRARTPWSVLPVYIGGGILFLAGLVLLAGAAFPPLDVVAVTFGAVFTTVGGLGLLAARQASVTVDSRAGVLIARGDFRRSEIALADVAEVFAERAPHVLPWVCLWVRKRSGPDTPLQSVQLVGVSGGRSHQRLGVVCDAINERLRSDQIK